MDDEVLESLRAAYNHLAAGDVDAMTTVLDPYVHWRGTTRGLLRRRQPY